VEFKIISGDQRDRTETALKQSNAAISCDIASSFGSQQDIAVAKANFARPGKSRAAKIMLCYTTLRCRRFRA